jgi:metal-sulfur cluster biosynthetic enzyme
MILEALREIEDPELGIGIVDLGLVYGIDVDGREVRVMLTLTSPGCPVGPVIQAAVHGAAMRAFPGAETVKVDLVWSPLWDPYQMASEEAKDMLGIW